MVAAIDNNYYYSKAPKQYNFNVTAEENNDFDKSIFDFEKNNSESNIMLLKEELQDIKDKQGCFQNGLNGVKEFLGIGTSASKCESAIEKYEKGEISYEEAEKELNKYATKQDNGLNLFANIAVSALAITAATLTAGAAAPLAAVAIGATVGAVTKAGVKLIDRGTNNVQGDDFDANQLAKDALSGAVTGGIAAATMGNGKAVEGGFKEAIKANAPRCIKTGIKAGAISGSANYAIDCAFDKDKTFNIDELANSTLANAAVGGVVGGIMGSANGVLKTAGIISHGGKAAINSSGEVVNNSIRDIAANSACSAEYKVLTRAINDIKS